MAQPTRRPPTDSSEPIAPSSFSQAAALELWRTAQRHLLGSRARIIEAEDVALGRVQLVPPKHLTSQSPDIGRLVPRLAQRRSLVLNMTNTVAETRPVIERKRPPKGGATTEARAEEIETASNALLLDLFPWDQAAGRSVQHAEYAIVTLLAQDAWDAKPDYTDVLTQAEWAKLPKSEQKTYRAAEKDAEGGADDSGAASRHETSAYSRPKKVYWRDDSGRGLEDDAYSRRSGQKTQAAYEDVLADHLAQHAPFAIRCYSATDCAPIFDANGLYALCVRQLMEPSDLLARGYRWDGLVADDASGTPRVLIPHGVQADVWGVGNKVYLYQYYLWLANEDEGGRMDPHVAYLVGGQQTYVIEDDEQVPALTNLRTTWGFSRLPCGYYYGAHLETDDPDDKGVPYMTPIGEAIVAFEGLLGAVNITAWRRGTSKLGVVPAENVPPAAYLDADDQLKPIDVDPDADVVTLYGPIQSIAPIEHSGDTRWVVEQLAASVADATPSSAAFGGEGSSSGREAAMLHTYAMSAQSMTREGLRQAYQDAAGLLLEWACCFMRTKDIDEIPYYADVEADPQDGTASKNEQTIMVRLKEAWIGQNYKVTAKYPPAPNPVIIQQVAQLAQMGYATFDDIMEARGKTNVLRERVRIINDRYWLSERGQAELSALDARRRGDIEQAKQIEATLAGHAAPLAIGPDGKPQQVGPSAAMDPMFGPQSPQTGPGGPTAAQSALGGTVAAGRGAAQGDLLATAGAPAPAGILPPNGQMAPGM